VYMERVQAVYME
jgi:hypothetical protein